MYIRNYRFVDGATTLHAHGKLPRETCCPTAGPTERFEA
jgi:hypothetical protein